MSTEQAELDRMTPEQLAVLADDIASMAQDFIATRDVNSLRNMATNLARMIRLHSVAALPGADGARVRADAFASMLLGLELAYSQAAAREAAAVDDREWPKALVAAAQAQALSVLLLSARRHEQQAVAKDSAARSSES